MTEVADLRHDAARRHAARGHLARGRDKLRIARAARRARRRLHRGRLARLEPEGRRALRARARPRRGSTPTLAAFGATRRAGIAPRGRRRASRALLDAGTRVVHDLRQDARRCTCSEVLRTTLDENLAMIEDSVALPARARPARDLRRRALLRRLRATTPRYALETLRAAARGGAEAVVLCDTNGGTLPWEIEERRARACVAALAVADRHPRARRRRLRASPTRSRRCAPARRHVQGTINGYGERCGNANLCDDHPRPRAQARAALPADRARSPSSAERRALRRRGREPRARRARAVRRAQRVRAQGRRPRRRDAPRAALVPARRSGARRQRARASS